MKILMSKKRKSKQNKILLIFMKNLKLLKKLISYKHFITNDINIKLNNLNKRRSKRNNKKY